MKQIYARNGPIRVLVLLGCLSLSLLVLGGVGSLLVWRLNDAYVEMVARELPLQAHLRSITSTSNLTRRALNSVIQSGMSGRPPAEALIAGYRSTVEVNNQNFAAMSELLRTVDEPFFLELHSKREAYLEGGKTLLDDLPNLTQTTVVDRRHELDQLFAAYLDSQDTLANHLGEQASARGNKVIREGQLLTMFFIVVALWPAIVAALFFGYLTFTTLFAFFKNR